MKKKNSLWIAIDFDGTCVADDFPRIGKDIGAAQVLKKITKAGHKLILNTMRSDIKEPKSNDPNIVCVGGNYLSEAVDWFIDNGIVLSGINTNPTQKTWTKSPKTYADLYIDDRSLGVPLLFDPKNLKKSYVDWELIENLLVVLEIIEP